MEGFNPFRPALAYAHRFYSFVECANRGCNFIAKLAFTASLIFASDLVTAQSFVPNSGNPVKYIDILPPSPSVAKLGDFSRPGVGMVSGAMQLNIPITSVPAHNFNIPISVSYSSNGVKVDEIASRVGMGWQLEAGGAITRSIRGERDESSQYLQLPSNHPSGPEDVPPSWSFIYMLRKAAQGQASGAFDTEPDAFSFSFCGYTGKFILDENDNPIQTNKSNLKIERNFSGTDWNFKVTDANGIEFHFGGTGYVENSKKAQTCGKSFDNLVPTAWFLRKIVLYNGDIINFSYASANYRYDLGVNQTMYYTDQPTSIPGNNCACPSFGTNQSVNTCVNYVDTETKYLTSISTPDRTVTFGYTSRNDSQDKKLSSVTVAFSGTGTSENISYALNYDEYQTTGFAPSNLAILTSENQYRIFLKEITKSSGGETVNLYKFFYNDPAGLPVRMSFAQDHWGYFNGKSNTISIPKPASNQYVLRKQFAAAIANRETDSAFSDKGVLTKVEYPTRGYDKIEWETNTLRKTRTIYPDAISIYGNSKIVYGVNFNEPNTQTNALVGTLTIGFEQLVKFYLKASNVSNPPVQPTQHHVGKIIVVGSPGNPGFELSTDTGTEKFEERVMAPGSYTIYYYAYGNITKTEGSITYIPGPPVTQTKNWPVAGVRVKNVKSYNYDNVLLEQKRYAYSTLADSLVSSGITRKADPLYMKPIDFHVFALAPNDGSGLLLHERICSYANMFSTSLINLFNPSGTSVAYHTVLEYSGPNSSNGVIEHRFSTSEDTEANILIGNQFSGATPNNNGDIAHGREFETNYYKKQNGQFSLIKRQRNIYKWPGNLISDKWGVVVNKYYGEPYVRDSSTSVNSVDWRMYDASKYRITSTAAVLDSVIEEHYAATQKLVTIKKYSYDDFISLQPTEITTTDSRGRLVVTKNYYSSNASSSPELAQDASQLAFLNTLKQKNYINELVHQTTTVGGSFVGSYKLFYDNLFGPIYPAAVKEYFASGVEAKAFYIDKYDGKGNITQRRKSDGLMYSYIWDYGQSSPTAEFVGAAEIEVAATSFESNGTGNWTFTGGTIVNDATAPTGQKVYNLGSLNKASLNSSKTYTLSYAYKNGSSITVTGGTNGTPVSTPGTNGWTTVTIPISSATTITITGTGYIDEVRIYPSSAQINTLTYDPLRGATSATDANFNTKYFEYDALGRLKNVRDNERYLLSTYRYNYRGPLE